MLLEDPKAAEPDRTALKRIVIAIGSLGFTAFILYLAFLLGAWGFDTRRFGFHEGRLRRLLASNPTPTIEQVTQGLHDEGTRLLASSRMADELQTVVSRWGRNKSAEVREKGTRWAETRVFSAGDMVYVLYFDADGLLKDFTCVSK